MKSKKHAFILYEYNTFLDDYTQVMEYYSVKELKEKNNFKIHNKTMYKYITNSLDNIKSKIENKYIIIKEEV